MKHYDIAVIGGGLAGLSLLYHYQRAGLLDDRRILLVDPTPRKAGHDRTWCFWERGAGPFEPIVYHRWGQVRLHNDGEPVVCRLEPYAYKLIRSDDFYALVNAALDRLPNLERLTGAAADVRNTEGGVRFRVGTTEYRADRAYSSRPLPLDYRAVRQPYLDQHFRGWFVETEDDTFDPEEATLMDFRTPQLGETRFFYVMPFTRRRALVEVAIFGNEHLRTPEYDDLLRRYIRDHWTTGGYRIDHYEQGNIPMTTYPYPHREGNLIYIGLGGGAARPSTGYAFFGLQRQLARMARCFPDDAAVRPWLARHLLYDATLLHILQRDRLRGADVLTNLFRKNPAPRVLAFLNGESSIAEELRLMTTAPTVPFARSFAEVVFTGRGKKKEKSER